MAPGTWYFTARVFTSVGGESEQTNAYNAYSEGGAVIWGSGKLLTAEQTVRLARLSGVDRDQRVQLIAAHLREHAEYTKTSDDETPPHGYAAHIGDDVI